MVDNKEPEPQTTTHTASMPTVSTIRTGVAKPEPAVQRPASPTSYEPEMEKPAASPLDTNSPTEPSNDPEYPPFRQRLLVMIAILLAVFLIALDRTIIATAIPKITDAFHSLDDIGWYGSAFMLTTCAFQLLLGRVYTFHPPKHVFLLMILVFEVGSALCGAAPNSVTVIVGRAIQGVGAAGITAGAIVLLVATIPLADRP
ncbi:hypothetical protein LTR53_018345, partial [Teratosphaeriaceae sp. CCFEE 6253]